MIICMYICIHTKTDIPYLTTETYRHTLVLFEDSLAIHTYMHAYIHTYTYRTHLHTYIHTHMHGYMHDTYTHTFALPSYLNTLRLCLFTHAHS